MRSEAWVVSPLTSFPSIISATALPPEESWRVLMRLPVPTTPRTPTETVPISARWSSVSSILPYERSVFSERLAFSDSS